MRLPRPSPALVVACLALLLALGGASSAAVRATGTAENIVDPVNPAQIAKVDATGKLLVGDGAGGLTVDGAVRPLAPTSSFSKSAAMPGSAVSTVQIAGPTSLPIDVT